MSRSEITMVDVLRGPASTERSSQLHNEKPFEKTSDLLPSLESLQSQIQRFAISRRALSLSSTRQNLPSGTRPPTKTTSGCEQSPAVVISEPRSPVAADCAGYNTVPSNTHAKSDVRNGENGEISSDRLCASQHSGVGTPTPNPTPSSSLEITDSDSGTNSSTGHCTGSSLGSTLLSFGEGQPENGISTALREIFAKLPDDPFRGPVQIPRCSPTTFVYPHSSAVIGTAFDERFREVVNIFRHNTKEHPRLRENLQYIDYTLKLCGTSSRDSHPSILVFCRHGEFKDLNGLLTSKELKYQYCLRRPARKYPWSGSQASANEEGHRPFFNLYFWRQRIPRTLYWGQEPVRIHSQLNMATQRSETHSHMVPGLTMCGSVVELHGTESSFSTLGCVIKIDLEFYAITSMHAFRLLEPMKKLHSGEISHHRSADRSGACTSADEVAELPVYDEEPLYGSDTDSSDAMMEDGDYFIDDVEYESLAEDEEEEIDPVDSRSTVANDSYGNQTQTSGQMRDVKEMLALFPTPHELDESGELDLDWALIKLVDQQDWRPNAFVYPSISSSPVFLSKVDESQPTQETPVFIITSETTPQREMLQPGTSLLGGINGRTPSTMWTVVLSEQNSSICLKRGDSGSIVVDATTNTIYGHVVGSNPIGEIYITPYAAVLEQIQHRFPGSTVAIPEPISTLACLVDFYTMLVRDERSLESLRRLEEAYRKAAAGLDEVERISPRIFQPHSSDAAAGVSGDEESPSMLYGIKAYDEVCSQLAQTTRELQDKKQDITGLQVDIGELKKENDTAFRMFQDVFKTWDADKNLHASAPPAGASTVALPTTEHSNRAIPYSTSYITAAPATTATTSTTIPAIATALGSMATPGFLPPHALRSVMPASTHYPSSMLFGREASKPVGTPCSHSSSLMVRVLIRRLPLNTSEESLRLMVVWSKELADVELLPVEQSEDTGFRSALLRFHTMTGAHEAINMLDGRSNISNDAEMIVEILDSSPISARRYPTDTGSANPSSSASSTASSGPLSRQTSRFNSTFQSLESTSPPVNGVYPGHELPNPDMSLHYQNLFSPRPPIGNYLMSGKPLIAHDSIDDDETSDLLKDPVAYAEHLSTSQRRATAPQIPISRMAGLTLSTNKPPTSSPGVASPTTSQLYQRQTIPPVNPADQNPPCNTLYVGNLPIDTSEEELKAMFSKQRGYKRLCFRTKQNGPICFVEFEDVSFATKALHELYGQPLHNSVKGGIRLSFSKNPLGVRSGQALGQNNAAAIAGMDGLGSGRGIYHGTSKVLNAGHGHPYAVANFPGAANNGCGGPVYGGQMAAPPNSVLNNAPG